MESYNSQLSDASKNSKKQPTDQIDIDSESIGDMIYQHICNTFHGLHNCKMRVSHMSGGLHSDGRFHSTQKSKKVGLHSTQTKETNKELGNSSTQT